MLSTQTITTVKATVPVIREHGATVTKVFYENLLTENPELNSLFNQGNQASGHQANALANAVLAYAQYIETPEVLSTALKHITQKHASLFIKPEQYAVVGKYLLGAFAQVLGNAFTPEIHDAWAEAYGELAKMMISLEANLYQQGGAEWTDWRDFIIADKIRESSEITSFILRPKDGMSLPSYSPGQYISIRVFIPTLGYTQIRQYSLSDRFTPDRYRISVRKEPGVTVEDTAHPGLVSTVLHVETKVGDTVQLSRPAGMFMLEGDKNTNTNTKTDISAPLVLISAGVGVTPMVSMLNTALADSPERPISWIQGANSSSKRAFSAHIDSIAKMNSNVHVSRFLTNPTEDDRLGADYDFVGRIDLSKCHHRHTEEEEKEEEEQDNLFLSEKTTKYFICGPDSFMTSMREQLETLGVDASRIMVEKFGTGGF